MVLARAMALLSTLTIGLLLSACEEPAPEKVERVRAIKPYYVSEPAGGDVRRYSGEITASNTSALSFAVSGTVQTVEINQGDRVVKGQVLATLDPERFKLDVGAAQSELDGAKAEYDKAKLELERKRQLYQKGWVAKAAYDQAVAAADGAEGQLNLARSRLGLAERDQSNARLLAPFDGVIALRDVEPFTEVATGQTIFQIDSEGSFEVELSVPDSVIARVKLGAPITVEARNVDGCGCTGRITEIGSTTGAANTVPVKAALLERVNGLLPGMAVEASLALSGNSGPRGYLIPLVAVAPGDEQAQGYVFKFDADAGVVRKTPVEAGETVSGNLIAVADGIDAGDVIAAAGVSFLRDGQSVTLMSR